MNEILPRRRHFELELAKPFVVGGGGGGGHGTGAGGNLGNESQSIRTSQVASVWRESQMRIISPAGQFALVVVVGVGVAVSNFIGPTAFCPLGGSLETPLTTARAVGSRRCCVTGRLSTVDSRQPRDRKDCARLASR